MRESLVEWSEKTGTILLAPLFPARIPHPDEFDSYIPLATADCGFDTVLNGVIHDIRGRADVDNKPTTSMFGFLRWGTIRLGTP